MLKHRIYISLLTFLTVTLASFLSSGQTVVDYTTPGQQTFTVPAGVFQITVEAWGGGGAGGGAKNGRGGGGGGGAYVRSVINVTPNTTYNLMVAAAKTSTVTSTAAQNKGNASWFWNTTTLFAEGGNGGGPSSSPTGGTGAGANSIGSVKFAGGDGTTGNNSSGGTGGGGAGSTQNGGNATTSAGGAGGSLNGGNGGGLTGNNSPGLPGLNYGGGGAGAQSQNNNQSDIGGAGAQGLVRITYGSSTLAATATSTPSCQGASPGTGTITVTATGGNPPYQYKLGTGSYQSSGVFNALNAGTYTVTVADNTNATVTISNIIVGSISSTMPPMEAIVSDASCNSPSGSINITNIPTALTFSKAQQTYIDLGGSLLNNLSQFTIEGWIKIDKSLIAGERTWGLFGQNDAIEFGIMNSTTMQLWTANGGQLNISMANYPGDNQWHHLAGVGNGSQLIIYIDGIPVGTTSSTTANYGSSTFHSMIGGNIWDATGNFLDGSILKTSMWSRALSAQEIETLASTRFTQYASGQPGLIAGYNYFEGAGSTLSKVGTASVNGTLVNSPQWTEVFTYSWIMAGNPAFTATTKNISSLNPGQYSLTASFPGICPVSGTWIVGNLGINTWTGNIDINWNNSGNWTCSIPTLTVDAVIPSGLSRYPKLSTGAVGMCKNLQIMSGAGVIVQGNTLQIAGTIQNSGTFDATQGTIEMKGTSAQVIPAGTFSGNAVDNLTINNASGVSLNGTLYIYSVLTATTGTFTTNNNLTLLSTPIQTAFIDGTGTGNVTGEVTVQRFIPSAFGYKYLSSPYTGIQVSQYAEEVDLAADFPTFYSYNENQLTTGWDIFTNPADVLTPGAGYALNFGTAATPLTIITKGIVNNGTIGPVTLYNHNQPYTLGFNLVGNPYPSPIDWNATGWTKTNIDNAVYYFDAGSTNQYQGTYSSYINGISSNGVANNIIPAQQAFFVHVKDGVYPVQGTLTFTNAVRFNTFNATFHKNTSGEAPMVRLAASYRNTGFTDYLVVYNDDMAAEDFNPETDALKIMNTDVEFPNFYVTGQQKKNTSIKSIRIRENNEISLGITAKNSGYITIIADTISNLAQGMKVFLKDTYSGVIREITRQSGYTFSINNATFDDRFKLIFSTDNLSSEAFGSSTFTAYTKNGSIFLNSKLSEEQALVRVFDLTGKLLLEKSVTGEGEHNLGRTAEKGIYIVTVYTDMGIISNKVYLD